MNTVAVRHFIETLDVESAPLEAVGQALRDLNTIRETEKELRKVLTARLLARVEASGPVVIDGIRWYAGNTLTYEVDDVPALLDAIFTASGGDFSTVTASLKSEWFKVSELRLLLKADFDKHVRQVRKPKLVDGVPTKQLLSADPQFDGGRR